MEAETDLKFLSLHMRPALLENMESWINIGYEAFALYGESGLKVEPLAKLVGTSKSSFYHYFSDTEIFMDFLLKHHVNQSQIIAKKEFYSQNIDPDLINVLIEHKIDLLFNKQLRIKRDVKAFESTLSLSNKVVGNSFKKVWIKELNSKVPPTQIDRIFDLALDNFFLNINPSTFSHKWFSEYFASLNKLAKGFV